MANTLDIAEIQVVVNFPADANGFFWHHRVLLHKVGGGRWVGLSPDLEVGSVDLHAQAYQVLDRRAPFPVAIAAQVYAFDPIGRAELERFKRQARTRAQLLNDEHEDEQVALVWLVSDVKSPHFGRELDDVTIANAAIISDRGVCDLENGTVFIQQMPATEAGTYRTSKDGTLSDLRLSGDHRDGRGRRHLTFHAAVDLCKESKFDDWPIQGPRASMEFVQAVRDGGFEPSSYHLQWLKNSGTSQYGAAAHEHRVLLESMFGYDL